jgi:hypothetical protein
MESLEDLLGRYRPEQPDEILLAKRYIMDNFKAEASVGTSGETLVITVHSAALANTLRLRILDLQEYCKTSKKIVLRIG